MRVYCRNKKGSAINFFRQHLVRPTAACSIQCVISHGNVTGRRRNLLDEERKKKKTRDISSRNHSRIISCLRKTALFFVQMGEFSCVVCARACARMCHSMNCNFHGTGVSVHSSRYQPQSVTRLPRVRRTNLHVNSDHTSNWLLILHEIKKKSPYAKTVSVRPSVAQFQWLTVSRIAMKIRIILLYTNMSLKHEFSDNSSTHNLTMLRLKVKKM